MSERARGATIEEKKLRNRALSFINYIRSFDMQYRYDISIVSIMQQVLSFKSLNTSALRTTVSSVTLRDLTLFERIFKISPPVALRDVYIYLNNGVSIYRIMDPSTREFRQIVVLRSFRIGFKNSSPNLERIPTELINRRIISLGRRLHK